ACLQGEGGKEGELLGHLRTLQRRDFVHEHEVSTVTAEREFAFKHILIRDVAYNQLPKSRRADLHVRFADWVEALPTTPDGLVEIVAYHLEQACHLTNEIARPEFEPPIGRAVRALQRAGERAEAREGMREADSFYARALAIVAGAAGLATEVRLRRANVLL